jgi:hypothetical protein
MSSASRPSVCLVAVAFAVSSVSFVSFVSSVSLASAQPADVVGVRASGMGGAFTAVADDATASWWNPAGMAGGAYFNALLESGTHREPPTDRNPAGDARAASRADTRSLAVAFPALGLSYYRLRISDTQPQISTGPTAAGRQGQQGGAAEVRLRSMVLNQFGASVGQSLGSHLVVASTVKLVHGGAVSQVQAAAGSSLDAATGLGPSEETHAGLDVGAMAVLGRARFGLMVRNVTEPEFGAGSDAFTLRRQARAGVARGDRVRNARDRRRSYEDHDGAWRRTSRGGGRRGLDARAKDWNARRIQRQHAGRNAASAQRWAQRDGEERLLCGRRAYGWV